jgi:predicted alpha/beta hydrolase family esterase
MHGNVDRVAGMMLVSVPDPLSSNFPAEASGFPPPALRPLPCKSIVVSSEDDPYGTPAYMRRCADAWGSVFINAGAAGHINAASNLDKWEQGLELLRTLL